jgi:hypothetical protein
MKRQGYETMRPLLVLLERLWDPLGASLRALGASLGALRKEVRWEHFSPPEMATARETSSLN